MDDWVPAVKRDSRSELLLTAPVGAATDRGRRQRTVRKHQHAMTPQDSVHMPGRCRGWVLGELLLGAPCAPTPPHPFRRPDHERLRPLSEAPSPPDYPKPDGVLTFDLPTSLYRSGTNHEHDQPSHLQIKVRGMYAYGHFQGGCMHGTRNCSTISRAACCSR